MKIAVLGDGGWGTALAVLLKTKGFDVSLWGAFRDNIDKIKKDRENAKFLPGIKVPTGIQFTCDVYTACRDADLIILAIPSRFLRQVLVNNKDSLKESRASFVSVVKGLEEKSLKRMSEVLFEILGEVDLAVLSGPSIAPEVARRVPTAVVVSSKDDVLAGKVRDVFRTERFRVYTNRDIIGVEIGGSLKNIIAIAAGISDGLGFGANTKAAILTRGLLEMTRLGVAMGASKETFIGLSGLGDLITTCTSSEGRNRGFGEKIGKGANPEDVLRKSAMEIEGAWTSKAALRLGKRHKLELPITQQVYSVLFEKKSPFLAVNELMTREPKVE
ncbi:MAG: NAD(P)-dependent glycerol-3-phosphate dehydrogenase [Candidatus Omnitrophica bacterium]|nr:NAD(P)-dependent glycerol-3-phosphate dehydrogenase [Candidatus Omnitrophota bacterium]